MSLKELRKEVQKYVTEDVVKQVYFYCNNEDKNGLFPDEVDLIEFAERLVAVIGRDIAKAEAEVCVEIVSNLNPEVGKRLRELRLK